MMLVDGRGVDADRAAELSLIQGPCVTFDVSAQWKGKVQNACFESQREQHSTRSLHEPNSTLST